MCSKSSAADLCVWESVKMNWVCRHISSQRTHFPLPMDSLLAKYQWEISRSN